jgi:hypothetical protein
VLDTTLEVSLHIPLSAAEIYAFMATPDNWVGTFAATKAVRGENTDRPVPVGARFVDVIEVAPDTTVEVEWTVTRDEPGAIWQMTTDPAISADPADGTVHIVITYTFAGGTETELAADTVAAAAGSAGAGAGTLVTRALRATYLGNSPIPLAYRDSWTDQAGPAHFLQTVRETLLNTRSTGRRP